MLIGIDNVKMVSEGLTVDIGHIDDIEEKYVYAVDHKVDIVVTSNREVAKYFKGSGIDVFVEL